MAKKLYFIIIILLFFASVSYRTYAFQVNEKKTTVKISPIEDTTVINPEPVGLSTPLYRHRHIASGYISKDVAKTPHYGVRKALYAFNLSDIPENAIITSANLNLFFAGYFQNSSRGQTHFMHLLKDNWHPDIKYADLENMPFDQDSITTFFIPHDELRLVAIDVFNIVKRAKEINYLPNGNLNLLLTGNTEKDSSNDTFFFSKDCNCPEYQLPFLEITYITHESETNRLDLNGDGIVSLLDVLYLITNIM